MWSPLRSDGVRGEVRYFRKLRSTGRKIRHVIHKSIGNRGENVTQPAEKFAMRGHGRVWNFGAVDPKLIMHVAVFVPISHRRARVRALMIAVVIDVIPNFLIRIDGLRGGGRDTGGCSWVFIAIHNIGPFAQLKLINWQKFWSNSNSKKNHVITADSD